MLRIPSLLAVLAVGPLVASAFCPTGPIAGPLAQRPALLGAPARRVGLAPLGLAMSGKKKAKPTFKGFGSVPDKMIDRTPKSADEKCACCSDKSYAECCQPHHNGDVWPETPLALMRSRYSAYAYRLPQWIIDTTHKTNVDWRADKNKWRRELTGFCDGFDFLGLEVVAEADGESADEYFVEFVAKLRTSNQPRDTSKGVQGVIRTIKSRNGEDYVDADFRERSRFLREGGKWMYAAGDVDFDPSVEFGGITVAGNKAEEAKEE